MPHPIKTQTSAYKKSFVKRFLNQKQCAFESIQKVLSEFQ